MEEILTVTKRIGEFRRFEDIAKLKQYFASISPELQANGSLKALLEKRIKYLTQLVEY